MKKTKVVMALACAVLLVGASVMSTLAYLTSTTDEVKNSFTVGDAVTITLDEAKTDENGKADTTVARVKANTYKLMPGHNYAKDPTVHVSGEECYVFVTVTNGISNIEATGDTTIAKQMTTNGWKAVEGYDNVYVYATGTDAKTAVAKKSDGLANDLVVFSSFTVKSDADHDALKAVKDNNIVIKAYAIQKDGFESKTPAVIWAENFATSGN